MLLERNQRGGGGGEVGYWHAMTAGERLALLAMIVAFVAQWAAVSRGAHLATLVCGFIAGGLACYLWISLRRPKGHTL